MAYLPSSSKEPVPAELIEALGRLLGLVIPPEDLPSLSTALRDQLAAMEAVEALDLSGITPVLHFDPGWDD